MSGLLKANAVIAQAIKHLSFDDAELVLRHALGNVSALRRGDASTTAASSKRAEAGRANAAKRWQSGGNGDGKPMVTGCQTDGNGDGNTIRLPSKGEEGEGSGSFSDLPSSQASPEVSSQLTTGGHGVPSDAAHLLNAWSSGCSRGSGLRIGLQPRDREALYVAIKDYAFDDAGNALAPGQARADALESMCFKFATWRRKQPPIQQTTFPLTPNGLARWIREENPIRYMPPERQSGTRKASEPARVAFELPKAAGGAT